MNSEDVLRTELVALLEGGNAHMEFHEVIGRFPFKQINAKGKNVPYSAWQLLEHMRITQWDIVEFIRNPKHISPDYPAGYRPRTERHADEAQWNRTVQGFREDLHALVNIARDKNTDIFSPIPHARNYTIFREILLVADHNAYHIGEFAMFRQVMELWPADNQYLTGTAA